MKRTLLVLGSLLFVACGGSPDDLGTNPLCEEDAGPGASSVRITCPPSLDLGCLDPTAHANVPTDGITAVSCDGASLTTTCTPASVAPGSTDVTCTASDANGHKADCVIHVKAGAKGSATLTCHDPASAHCTGPKTSVTVPAPTVDTTCGGTTGTPTSNAPAGGFPLGTTTVHWTLGASSCDSKVVVVDDAPPKITCPPSGVVASATPPSATATDPCDPAVTVSASPTTLTRGAPVTVTYTAKNGAGLTATCTSTFTLIDAPPVPDVRVLSAHEASGTTSVTVAWAPSTGADVTGYRLEASTASTGPWHTIASTTSDHLFLTDPSLVGDHGYYRVVTTAAAGDGGASASVLAHAVDEDLYDLEGETIPKVPFPTSIYGVVRHPRDLTNGPYPLVLMLHGNHGNCRPVGYPAAGDDNCADLTTYACTSTGFTTTPNEAGYIYLADTLAAKGYVVATLNANALNCRETGGSSNGWIRERAQLLIANMLKWQTWSTTGATPFASKYVGAVDMSRVGLFGHSRGGEAVAAVADEGGTALPGITVGAIFSLAPTAHWTDPTPHGVPYAVLVPACDGDVSSLEGIALYDSMRAVGGPLAQAQLFVNGANHDFFNTEWRFDDNGDGKNCNTSVEIGGPAQRGYLEGALGSYFDHTIGAGSTHVYEDFLEGDADIPGAIQQWAGKTVDVRVSYGAPTRQVIADEYESGAPLTDALGQPDTFSPTFYVARRCAGTTDCDTSFPHAVPAMFLSWMSSAQIAHWGLGSLDTSAYDHFSFRIVSRRSTLNGSITTMDMVVHLTDADGTIYDTTLGAIRTVPHLYASNMQREILQTERIDLAKLKSLAPALDLVHLSAFELETSTPAQPTGSVLVTDIELAKD